MTQQDQQQQLQQAQQEVQKANQELQMENQQLLQANQQLQTESDGDGSPASLRGIPIFSTDNSMEAREPSLCLLR